MNRFKRLLCTVAVPGEVQVITERVRDGFEATVVGGRLDGEKYRSKDKIGLTLAAVELAQIAHVSDNRN
jgi:hypothetical protein